MFDEEIDDDLKDLTPEQIERMCEPGVGCASCEG